MQDLHEMYVQLYAEINSMPLPTSPDDPEPVEGEEYVEPGWVAQMDQTRARGERWNTMKDLHQMDACSRFEIAYEKAHEWDTLYPYYGPGPEPVFRFEEDQPDPSTI